MPSNRKMMIFLILLVFAAGGLYFFIKKKYNKPITERIYTNEKVTESESALVNGYPNVPTYPGMRIDKTYKKEQGGKTDFVGVWYYEGGDEKSPAIIGWYIDEFKKAGWTVEGPFIDQGQKEVHINAENDKYKARIMTARRLEEDEGGAGNIVLSEILEK